MTYGYPTTSVKKLKHSLEITQNTKQRKSYAHWKSKRYINAFERKVVLHELVDMDLTQSKLAEQHDLTRQELSNCLNGSVSVSDRTKFLLDIIERSKYARY